ncbi:macro domain-containing protein [Candidatus Uabimicrobium sp. HlEnr_7]|uniref:macro domain-containing protein n=1 Tax=Candidatus Uabimicrobium helgolandensis TaxID=3095367 RepID=UPI003556FCA2
MNIEVRKANIIDEEVDILISTANPSLNMSGGINGAILQRGGMGVQQELRDYLQKQNRHWVKEGTIVVTSPGPLKVKRIFHAVAINGFYESSCQLVSELLRSLWKKCEEYHGKTVAVPALATGYGPLSIQEFAEALCNSLSESIRIEKLNVVLHKQEYVEIVNEMLKSRNKLL